MKRYLGLVLPCILFGGCLAGCAQNAANLAGYSNPSVQIKAGLFSKTLLIGTNFNGEATYDPETGKFHVKVASAPEGVIAAEGERADHLVPLREIERMRIVETHKAIGETITKTIDLISAAAMTGSTQIVESVMQAAVPVLQGSALSLEGLGSANLGSPTQPPD